MKRLSREDILNAEDLPFEDVPIPEWGGVVRVRGLTGSERDRFEAAVIEQSGGGKVRIRMEDMRARLLVLALVDETGAPLFSENDIRALGQKNAAVLQRLFEVAMRLSGMTPQDVEELAKNSV